MRGRLPEQRRLNLDFCEQRLLADWFVDQDQTVVGYTALQRRGRVCRNQYAPKVRPNQASGEHQRETVILTAHAAIGYQQLPAVGTTDASERFVGV